MGSITNEHRLANLESRMAVSEKLSQRLEVEVKERLDKLSGQVGGLIEIIATGRGGISAIWKIGGILIALGGAFLGGSKLGH